MAGADKVPFRLAAALTYRELMFMLKSAITNVRLKQSMLLSKDQILQADDIKTRDVPCPEWGGDVRIRALTLKEGIEFRRGLLRPTPVVDPKTRATTIELKFNQEAAELQNAWLMTIACINPDGSRMFTKEDVEKLSLKSMAPIARIVDVITEISGLNPNASEEAEKNSEPNPSDSSSSS